MRSDGVSSAPSAVVKNGEYEAEVIGIGHEGEGVGRVNGFTLFIHGALPGERVRVKVLKLKKQYGYAKLLEVVEASPERTEAPCAIYTQCGGCQLQHLAYDAQLAWKRQLVVDNLERIGKLRVRGGGGSGARVEEVSASGAPWTDAGIPSGGDEGDAVAGGREGRGADGIVVRPTLGMNEPWRYRNKAQVPIGELEGGLVGGFYARGSHRIIDMDTCLIQHELNDDVVRRVKEIARKLGISAYDEVKHAGLLRHVVVKVGFRTGAIMIILITNGEKIPHADQWIEQIRNQVKGIKSICQNINTVKTNVIFGERTKVLWGSEVIHDYIGNVQFAISARSFYQVNSVQMEVLYAKTLEYAALNGEEIVIDAYCGIGTISLFLAQHAKKVYGVEIVREAIEDARKNAELNRIHNVEFAVGKSEEVIPEWKRRGIVPDVVVVDPPRKGCDQALLDTIIEMKPQRVVYVSCNPSTLARDLRILEDGGFRTVEVQPVDMFPHTTHVECIVSTHYTG